MTTKLIETPAAFSEVRIALKPGQTMDNILNTSASSFTQEGDDLVLYFDNHGEIRFVDFFIKGDKPFPHCICTENTQTALMDFMAGMYPGVEQDSSEL